MSTISDSQVIKTKFVILKIRISNSILEFFFCFHIIILKKLHL